MTYQINLVASLALRNLSTVVENELTQAIEALGGKLYSVANRTL